MAVTATFSEEIERALRERAAAAGRVVESLVGQLVLDWLAKDESTTKPRRRRRSSAEFCERLDAWTARHPVLDHPIDDSRESIYEGCGE